MTDCYFPSCVKVLLSRGNLFARNNCCRIIFETLVTHCRCSVFFFFFLFSFPCFFSYFLPRLSNNFLTTCSSSETLPISPYIGWLAGLFLCSTAVLPECCQDKPERDVIWCGNLHRHLAGWDIDSCCALTYYWASKRHMTSSSASTTVSLGPILKSK